MPNLRPPQVTRRAFTAWSFAPLLLALRQAQASQAVGADARLIGTVPFDLPRGAAPLGELLGSGLDARLFTDLASLDVAQPITPSPKFFIRTAASPHLPSAPWRVQIGGLTNTQLSFGVDELARMAAPAGTHLLECAGNAAAASFGLISAASWDGVPIGALIDRVGAKSSASHLFVSGFDDMETPTRTSVPGASWIFSRDDLVRAKAFLAVRMNGGPLPADHGGPVRLVVPGWYGCCWIKWVDRIELVDRNQPITSQMREYAARTHQNALPERARDYEPAVIDAAAMPVRVEKWMRDGRIVYRLVGILWGGAKPTNALSIRFKSGSPWTPVDECPLPPSTTSWTIWSHWWRPDAPGRYDIVLKVADPTIRTRRLDLFFYTRAVTIPDV
jgi:DMSO/TMAO reductase YedYZ molybdopterin-dependent catalytic subunit